MPDELSTRIERLEESERRAWAAIEALADKEERLDEALTVLTEAQIKTEQRWRESDQRFLDSDQRIQSLVSAIGEFLRRNEPKQ